MRGRGGGKGFLKTCSFFPSAGGARQDSPEFDVCRNCLDCFAALLPKAASHLAPSPLLTPRKSLLQMKQTDLKIHEPVFHLESFLTHACLIDLFCVISNGCSIFNGIQHTLLRRSPGQPTPTCERSHNHQPFALLGWEEDGSSCLCYKALIPEAESGSQPPVQKRVLHSGCFHTAPDYTGRQHSGPAHKAQKVLMHPCTRCKLAWHTWRRGGRWRPHGGSQRIQ